MTPEAPHVTAERPPDSRQVAEDHFVDHEVARPFPGEKPVDTSKIEHAVTAPSPATGRPDDVVTMDGAPVETGITEAERTAAPTSGADLEAQLFGKPLFEEGS